MRFQRVECNPDIGEGNGETGMRIRRILVLSLLAIGVSIALAKPAGAGDQDGAVQPFDATATKHLTTFDVPASTRTQPSSINPAGSITGSYQDASGVFHG